MGKQVKVGNVRGENKCEPRVVLKGEGRGSTRRRKIGVKAVPWQDPLSRLVLPRTREKDVEKRKWRERTKIKVLHNLRGYPLSRVCFHRLIVDSLYSVKARKVSSCSNPWMQWCQGDTHAYQRCLPRTWNETIEEECGVGRQPCWLRYAPIALVVILREQTGESVTQGITLYIHYCTGAEC